MRLTKKDITYTTSGANVIEIPDIVEGYKYTGQAVIKLGQLEDVLEKYGIDDIETLDKIIQIHKFLSEHDYQTLPKEEFDLLFNKLDELDEFKQNTINDFYESTKEMLDDLFDLSTTKLADFLQEGKLYTRTRIMEIYGTVIRYIKTFAYGGEFHK